MVSSAVKTVPVFLAWGGIVRYVVFSVIAFAATTLSVQSRQQFDVASVKVDAEQSRGRLPRTLEEVSIPIVRVLPGGRIESFGHTLRNLIAWAYDVNTLFQRIEGKQEVLDTEFVISAKAPTPSLTAAEAKTMVRSLLAERFHLQLRQQPREMDGYLLVPSREDARPGPRLRSFTGNCEARANNPTARFDSPDYEDKARCGWTGMNARQRGVGVSLASIADRLTGLMSAPVADGTGWGGLFTFDLTAGTDAMPLMDVMRRASGRGGPLPSTDEPQLLEVFRTELGLKLVKNRTSVNDFIVERAEALIEN
jgi:uncharacterized protein (TIGR03435 family)